MVVHGFEITFQFEAEKAKCLELYARDEQSGIAALRTLVERFRTIPEAYLILGDALDRAGKKQEALARFSVALQLDPKNGRSLLYLAKLFTELKMPEQALPLLIRAETAIPNHYLHQYLFGMCYEACGLGEKAVRFYKRALELDPPPDKIKPIEMQLAYSASNADHRELAVEIYGRLRVSDGEERIAALYNLSKLQPKGLSSELGQEVERTLSNPTLSNDNKILMYLAKGWLLERDKDHDRAFLAWTESKRYHKPKSREWADYGRKLKQLTAPYTKERYFQRKQEATSRIGLSLICGMPRSGTTLLEQIVSAHPQVTGIGEFNRWSQVEPFFRNNILSKDSTGRFSISVSNELEKLSAEAVSIMRVIGAPTLTHVVEKLPHNFMYFGFQLMLFPNARLLHMRRNPLDSFISTFRENFSQQHVYAFNQDAYLKEYLFKEQMVAHWQSLVPNQVKTVHYEELVARPRHILPDIFAFLGLEWDESVLEFHLKQRSVHTLSRDQVRNPINTKSVGRWRNYEQHLEPLLQAMREAKIDYPDFT
jgi:tetratricopeptide (TPR) repeat protein